MIKQSRRRSASPKLMFHLACHLLLTTYFSTTSFSSHQLFLCSCSDHNHNSCRHRPGRCSFCMSRRSQKASYSYLWDLPSNDGNELENIELQRNLGFLVLLTVPAAWGTFEPAVRYVYAIEPAIPSSLFTVAYYSVASISLLSLALPSLGYDTKEKDGQDDKTIRGGIELGSYLFLGNGLQVLGLKTVNADRAAFLLQLTTIMVPLLQAPLAGKLNAITKRTWVACAVALVGVAVMSFEGTDIVDIRNCASGISQGDLLIVLAALSYSFHCIRLSRYAKETMAIKLASCKAATETILSVAVIVGIMIAGNQDHIQGAAEARNEIIAFSTGIAEGFSTGSMSMSAVLPVIGAICWTGCVTIAYTITAQSYGQKFIAPSDANLIYTTQPIFTALFAWLLLGETLGTAGVAGGALIGLGVYLVATNDEGSVDEDAK